MILVEKSWRSSDTSSMQVKAYRDIEAIYLNFTPGIRVLPAPYYDDPSANFTLRAKYEEGQNPRFPNGGFEVYGPSGETRCFDIDQVIVHPYEVGQMKFFVKSASQETKTQVVDPNAPKRGRGRPKIAEGERKTPTVYVSTGRGRGRPANPDKPAKIYVPTGGKRGRPAKSK